MRRRSFLIGLGAVAAAPVVPVLSAGPMTATEVIARRAQWGLGPAHYALADMVEINARRYRLLATS